MDAAVLLAHDSTILQIPTGYGKSHVICLTAFFLLSNKKKVSIYFPNETIKERDLSLFAPMFAPYKDNFRANLKRPKGYTSLLAEEFEPNSDWIIIIDEIDASFLHST